MVLIVDIVAVPSCSRRACLYKASYFSARGLGISEHLVSFLCFFFSRTALQCLALSEAQKAMLAASRSNGSREQKPMSPDSSASRCQ